MLGWVAKHFSLSRRNEAGGEVVSSLMHVAHIQRGKTRIQENRDTASIMLSSSEVLSMCAGAPVSSTSAGGGTRHRNKTVYDDVCKDLLISFFKKRAMLLCASWKGMLWPNLHTPSTIRQSRSRTMLISRWQGESLVSKRSRIFAAPLLPSIHDQNTA